MIRHCLIGAASQQNREVLPAGYTRLEYLHVRQYKNVDIPGIQLDFPINREDKVTIDFKVKDLNILNTLMTLASMSNDVYNGNHICQITVYRSVSIQGQNNNLIRIADDWDRAGAATMHPLKDFDRDVYNHVVMDFKNKEVYVNNELLTTHPYQFTNYANLFDDNGNMNKNAIILKSPNSSDRGNFETFFYLFAVEGKHNIIPCLNAQEVLCLYDTIAKKESAVDTTIYDAGPPI